MKEHMPGDTLTDENFIRDRITQLRLASDISEYQLSHDLGHSRGYINNISSGKTLPSMAEFLNICNYFKITPMDFFDKKLQYPENFQEVSRLFPVLDKESQILVLQLIKKLQQ